MMHCRLDINDAERVLSQSLNIEGVVPQSVSQLQQDLDTHSKTLGRIMQEIKSTNKTKAMLESQLEKPVGAWKRRQNIIRKWSIENRKLPYLEKAAEQERKIITKDIQQLEKLI